MGTRFFLTSVILILFCHFTAIPGWCYDPFEQDTLYFEEWSVYFSGQPWTREAVVPVVVFNDEEVRAFRIPIKWFGPMSIDTAYFADGRADVFDLQEITIDTSVFNVITFLALSNGDPMSAGTGPVAYMHFVVYDSGWAEIDTGYSVTNFLVFNDPAANSWQPVVVPSYHHFEYCIGGDVNCDGIINIGDIIFLVNYLYRSGPPPDTPGGGDVNGDGNVDVGDIIYLINFLYRGGPVPKG